jgi:hypothetical protein
MTAALGPLQWRPAEFWAATVTEFFVAVESFSDMHADPKKVDAPDDDEMAALLEKYG